MAKATKIENLNARYSKPTGVIFVPWTDGNTLGSTGYDIKSIVGDTVSVTQDDADRSEIPAEFRDTPLDETITLGDATMTMECLDFDDDMLVALFGCTKINAGTAQAPKYVVAFPDSYQELYCLVQLEFGDKAVVFPKVKMDSKAVFENLRSDIARGQLSGTINVADVTIGETEISTPRLHVPGGVVYSIGDVKITVTDGETDTDITA